MGACLAGPTAVWTTPPPVVTVTVQSQRPRTVPQASVGCASSPHACCAHGGSGEREAGAGRKRRGDGQWRVLRATGAGSLSISSRSPPLTRSSSPHLCFHPLRPASILLASSSRGPPCASWAVCVQTPVCLCASPGLPGVSYSLASLLEPRYWILLGLQPSFPKSYVLESEEESMGEGTQGTQRDKETMSSVHLRLQTWWGTWFKSETSIGSNSGSRDQEHLEGK